jgi:hypothetical protein
VRYIFSMLDRVNSNTLHLTSNGVPRHNIVVPDRKQDTYLFHSCLQIAGTELPPPGQQTKPHRIPSQSALYTAQGWQSSPSTSLPPTPSARSSCLTAPTSATRQHASSSARTPPCCSLRHYHIWKTKPGRELGRCSKLKGPQQTLMSRAVMQAVLAEL